MAGLPNKGTTKFTSDFVYTLGDKDVKITNVEFEAIAHYSNGKRKALD